VAREGGEATSFSVSRVVKRACWYYTIVLDGDGGIAEDRLHLAGYNHHPALLVINFLSGNTFSVVM
jgi:hypothetical protein